MCNYHVNTQVLCRIYLLKMNLIKTVRNFDEITKRMALNKKKRHKKDEKILQGFTRSVTC